MTDSNEMCRQQNTGEVETAMRQLGLMEHPDVALSDKIINAYNNINDICFDGV